MKFFPVVAAFALHAVVALEHDSNADLASDSQSGSMSIEEFFKSQGINFTWFDSLPASESESMSASALGSGSMEFETIEDVTTYIGNIVDEWAPGVSRIMGDWAKPNSVEFKKFQKKMNKINVLVVDAMEMSGSGSDSMIALESLLTELLKEMDKVNTFVNNYVQNASADAGSLSIGKLLDVVAISEMAALTQGSDEGSITQTSVDSATQSSPSAQKTRNKQTETEPAAKSTK